MLKGYGIMSQLYELGGNIWKKRKGGVIYSNRLCKTALIVGCLAIIMVITASAAYSMQNKLKSWIMVIQERLQLLQTRYQRFVGEQDKFRRKG